MEAVEVLAGSVTLDLNNVLCRIIRYPELILLDIPEDNPLRVPILTIKESGEKGAVVGQDLLALARMGLADTQVLDIHRIISISYCRKLGRTVRTRKKDNGIGSRHCCIFARIGGKKSLQAISKKGFWFKIKAGRGFKPQAYSSMSRNWNRYPTQRLGQKTYLR